MLTQKMFRNKRMKSSLLIHKFANVCAGIALSLSVSAVSAEGRVPLPVVPKAQAPVSETQACVEPTDVMRKNHHVFLKHQRDDTMHQGIRTESHSLKNCINCHVTPNENGEYSSVHEDDGHFCVSCHRYAAVSIDCFQCHLSVPESAESNATAELGLDNFTVSDSTQ